MANALISDLGVHAALSGADLFEIEQAGPSSKYVTLAAVLAYIQANLAAQTNSVYTLDIIAGVVTIDMLGGRARNFKLLLDEAVTSIVFTNLPAAGIVGEFDLQLTQNGTGGFGVTLPATFKALGGSDTAVSLTSNSVTILSAKTFDQGTTWQYAMQESA